MVAKVVAHDPVALHRARAENKLPSLVFRDNAEDVFADADAVVLATEWPEYKNLPFADLLSKMNTPVFLDGRNFLDPQQMANFGFRYMGVGR